MRAPSVVRLVDVLLEAYHSSRQGGPRYLPEAVWVTVTASGGSHRAR
jgi:hypothetical protein